MAAPALPAPDARLLHVCGPPPCHPPLRTHTCLAHAHHSQQPMNWTENYIKEVPVSLLRPGVDTQDT
jgi:hypothetical protein